MSRSPCRMLNLTFTESRLMMIPIGVIQVDPDDPPEFVDNLKNNKNSPLKVGGVSTVEVVGVDVLNGDRVQGSHVE